MSDEDLTVAQWAMATPEWEAEEAARARFEEERAYQEWKSGKIADFADAQELPRCYCSEIFAHCLRCRKIRQYVRTQLTEQDYADELVARAEALEE